MTYHRLLLKQLFIITLYVLNSVHRRSEQEFNVSIALVRCLGEYNRGIR